MVIREIENDELYDVAECFEYLIDPETNEEFDFHKIEIGLIHHCKYDVYSMKFIPLGIKDKEIYGIVVDSEMEFVTDVIDPKTNGVKTYKVTISNDPFAEDTMPDFVPGQILKFYRVWDTEKKDPITYLDLKHTGLNMLLFDENGEFIVLPSVVSHQALFGEEYRASLTLSESDSLKKFIDMEKELGTDEKNKLKTIIDDCDDEDDELYDDEDDEGTDGYETYFNCEPYMIIGMSQFNKGINK